MSYRSGFPQLSRHLWACGGLTPYLASIFTRSFPSICPFLVRPAVTCLSFVRAAVRCTRVRLVEWLCPRFSASTSGTAVFLTKAVGSKQGSGATSQLTQRCPPSGLWHIIETNIWPWNTLEEKIRMHLVTHISPGFSGKNKTKQKVRAVFYLPFTFCLVRESVVLSNSSQK